MESTGLQYLKNPFPRTATSAALLATVEAAQREYDKTLSIKGCYHLFRLPGSLEDKLMDEQETPEELLSEESAMTELTAMADGAEIEAVEGPVLVGSKNEILRNRVIVQLAAYYLSALKKGILCYPYFSTEA